MIKVDQATLDYMESQHAGIIEQIRRWDAMEIPPCTHCGSTDTADVQVGVIGRTICLTAATSRLHLIANGPKPGTHFCNQCRKYSGPAQQPGELAGGGTFGPLQDESLQAYKDYIRGIRRALTGKEPGDETSEEDWVRLWKAFWDKGDEASQASDK
jgi:hypothetical protein